MLRSRGLVDDAGLTELGRDLRRQIEAITDERAIEPYDAALTDEEQALVLETLTPAARAVQDADVLPFPNPMGLPRL